GCRGPCCRPSRRRRRSSATESISAVRLTGRPPWSSYRLGDWGTWGTGGIEFDNAMSLYPPSSHHPVPQSPSPPVGSSPPWSNLSYHPPSPRKGSYGLLRRGLPRHRVPADG